MRLPATALLATLLAGCAAEVPPALEIDSVDDQQAHTLGWVVPGGSASAHAPRPIVPAPAAPQPAFEPSPLPPTRSTRPRLAFVWEWGEYAQACNFGVNFVGGPAVSEDGRYVIHDRKDDAWESDGGEGWEDYYAQEPLEEGELTLVDRETGTSIRLGSLLEEPAPHHDSGDLHCRKLKPLLKAGVERINAKIPDTTWRAMTPAADLGVRVLADGEAEVLAEDDADRRPLELMLRKDTFTLRRKGVEVLHREHVGPLRECNMPLVVDDVLIDVATGYTLATVKERCVCFGSESDQHFAMTLSQRARARIAALAPIGRAIVLGES